MLHLNPDAADAYEGRAWARANLGDRQGAIADMQRAAELYRARGDLARAQAVQRCRRR